MVNKEKEFLKICSIIKSHSGICVTGAHVEFLCSYIQKRIDELEITCDQYLTLIENDSNELKQLINESTINETYFFREEKQFLYLKNEVFPLWKGRSITIWSAACSTGEEVISLAMLCAECGINARIYGTDIDSNALEVLAKGEYNSVSVRTDGTVFHSILEKNSVKENGCIRVNSTVIQQIKKGIFNLNTFSGTAEIPPDGTADIIFLRNVFIYFDDDTRKNILSFMEKKLTHNGLLFFSMSEIASITPLKNSSLVKQKHDMVYFLQKGTEQIVIQKKQNAEDNSPQRKIAEKVHMQSTAHKKKSKHSEGHSEKTGAKNENELPLASEVHKADTDRRDTGIFESVVQYLDKNKLDEAERLLDSHVLQIDIQYVKSYYKGLIEKMRGNDDSALQWFERAAQLNPLFWTAHIQCALLLNDKDPVKARRKYIRCAELLEKYIEEKSTKYDFLLESFSAEYFYSICTKNIEKGIQNVSR